MAVDHPRHGHVNNDMLPRDLDSATHRHATGTAPERRFAKRSTVLPSSRIGRFACGRCCAHTACGFGSSVQLDLQTRNGFVVTVVRIDDAPIGGIAWIGEAPVRIDATGSARMQFLVDPIPAPLQITIVDIDGQSIGFHFASTTV